MNSPLFETVANQDSLHFGFGRNFQPKRVCEWLDFRKDDVARIASVASSSVRFDEHIPQAVVERFQAIANTCNMVAEIFDGDIEKTALWFKTKNPLLGDITPRDMIRLGRYDRLRKFIVSAVLERGPQKNLP